MEVFELDVWKNDWGLPSIDTDCLQVLAYAKIHNIPLKVNTSGNPFRTPNGRLPVLRCSDGTFDTVEDIIGYFRKKFKNSTTETKLSQKQSTKFVAYSTMFKAKLFPALQFIWWIDKKNADEFIRPWYCKALPFPLNFYYPGKFERQARSMLEVMYPVEDDINVIENKVYSEAQQCLTLLSTMLGDSQYFSEDGPGALDAIIYSYLAPLLRGPLPNPALQNHLKACTNLVEYVLRITQKYFQNEYNNYEQLKAEDTAQKVRRDSESEYPNKRRNQILAGLFASLAMVGYAFSTGLVEVPLKERGFSNDTSEYVLEDEDEDEEHVN